MKRTVLLLLALLSLLALTVAGASAQGVSGGSQNIGIVTMHAQNGSGEDGSAVLSDVNGQLMVTIELQNGTSIPQPAHIHQGTCANLNPSPAYPLNSVVNGKSTTTVDVSLGTLMSGQYAINVHKSAAEVTTYVSCGDISQMARAGGTAGGTSGGTSGGPVGMPATGNTGADVLQALAFAVLAIVGLGLVTGGALLARRRD